MDSPEDEQVVNTMKTHYLKRLYGGLEVAACGECDAAKLTEDVSKVDCQRCARTVGNLLLGTKTASISSIKTEAFWATRENKSCKPK
jgi:hypothetical protein